MAILASVFKAAPVEEVQKYVASAPRGKYARRLWFLYEMLTGSSLPMEDLKTGGYIDLIEPAEYYTVVQPRPVRRQRINDNLLGDGQFCPTIRRTEALRGFEKADLPARCRKIDLFIQACLPNNGRLSARKRASHFEFLSDDELAQMEDAIRSAYGNRETQEP